MIIDDDEEITGYRYQRVCSKLWEDEKFIGLNAVSQAVFLYLLTNPHSNMIGLYTLAIPAKRVILNLKDMDEFYEYMDAVERADMIRFDGKTALVLIKNYLKYNPIKRPNSLKAAKKMLRELPKSFLLHDFFDILMDPKVSRLGTNKELIPVINDLLGSVVDPYPAPEEPVDDPKPEEESPSIPVLPAALIPTKLILEDCVEKWNDICGRVLPRVSRISDNRRALILARIEEFSIEKVIEVFHRVMDTPFLIGENSRGWTADFDFVMTKSKFLKILEGSYVGKQTDPMKKSLDVIGEAIDDLEARNQLGEEDGRKDILPGSPDDSG